LISAKNRVDLSSISEVRSYITEWPRFFGPPCMFGLVPGGDRRTTDRITIASRRLALRTHEHVNGVTIKINIQFV